MNELTLKQRGAYNSILDLLYSRDGDVPDDDVRVARMICCNWREWKAVKAELIALGKIWLEGGKIRAKRVKETLREASDFSQEQRKKASERWQKSEKPNENNGPVMPQENASRAQSTPIATPTVVRDDAARTRDFDDFDSALRSIPGVASHPIAVAPVIAPIWQMHLNGFDFQAQIRPSIERQVANARRPITSWAYFVPGILADAKPPPINHNVGTANGTAQKPASLSPRQAHLAKLRQRAVDAKLRELREAGEGGDSGGPDIAGAPGNQDGKPGLPGRPH